MAGSLLLQVHPLADRLCGSLTSYSRAVLPSSALWLAAGVLPAASQFFTVLLAFRPAAIHFSAVFAK